MERRKGVASTRRGGCTGARGREDEASQVERGEGRRGRAEKMGSKPEREKRCFLTETLDVPTKSRRCLFSETRNSARNLARNDPCLDTQGPCSSSRQNAHEGETSFIEEVWAFAGPGTRRTRASEGRAPSRHEEKFHWVSAVLKIISERVGCACSDALPTLKENYTGAWTGGKPVRPPPPPPH